MTATYIQEMINPDNLTPKARVDELIECAEKFGSISTIAYLLNELANHTRHKNFDDECYWKDVEQEFKLRAKYDN